MAIPFVLPSDEDSDRSEIELEQLLGELIDINQQIQILLRARMQSRAAHNLTVQRVCPLSRQRVHHHNPAAISTSSMVPPSVLPDLVRSSQPSATPAPVSNEEAAARRRHHRLADDAAEACCHAKFTAAAEVDVDWKQVGVIVRRFADVFKTAERVPYMSISPSSSPPPSCTEHAIVEDDKSLLSKFIPATTSSRSLWTAVICVVGWHIFRAR